MNENYRLILVSTLLLNVFVNIAHSSEFTNSSSSTPAVDTDYRTVQTLITNSQQKEDTSEDQDRRAALREEVECTRAFLAARGEGKVTAKKNQSPSNELFTDLRYLSSHRPSNELFGDLRYLSSPQQVDGIIRKAQNFACAGAATETNSAAAATVSNFLNDRIEGERKESNLLHIACDKRNLKIIDVFIQLGANKLALDANNDTPLHRFCMSIANDKTIQTVRLNLAFGGYDEDERIESLRKIVKEKFQNDKKITELLCARQTSDNINIRDRDGKKALSYLLGSTDLPTSNEIIESYILDIADILILHGATLDGKDVDLILHEGRKKLINAQELYDNSGLRKRL